MPKGQGSAGGTVLARPPQSGAILSLTPRQMEYMLRVARGQTAKEIAYDEGITEHAVKQVTRRAREKVGAQSTIDFMHRMGWVRLP